MARILLVGDMHLKTSYGHADLFADRRREERLEIEEAIVSLSGTCDWTVLLGDVLNGRENHPSVLTRLSELKARMGNVLIISGNHEAYQDGTGALDVFEKEAGKTQSEVLFAIREPATYRLVDRKTGNYVAVHAVPYMYRQETLCDTNEAASDWIMGKLHGHADLLVCHHSIAGTVNSYGIGPEMMNEPILDQKKLEDVADFVVGGHVHDPYDARSGRTFVAGAVMNEAFGEDKPRRVLILDTETKKVTSVPLPGRRLAKLTDPTEEQLKEWSREGAAVKVVLSKDAPEMPSWFSPECLLVERVEKAETALSEGNYDMTVPSLLAAYSEERGVDMKVLERGLQLIEQV
jgi:predicted phosphodiesterase